MRYLKTYEEEYNKSTYYNSKKYKIGDTVILLNIDVSYLISKFKIGNLYTIFDVDKHDNIHPYSIIDNKYKCVGWVKEEDIRSPYPWEIESMKYNL